MGLDYKILYKKGVENVLENVAVDAFSRQPVFVASQLCATSFVMIPTWRSTLAKSYNKGTKAAYIIS